LIFLFLEPHIFFSNTGGFGRDGVLKNLIVFFFLMNDKVALYANVDKLDDRVVSIEVQHY